MQAFRDLLRSVPLWGLVVGLLVGVLGFLVDSVLVLVRSPTEPAWYATGIAAGGLGALLGLALSPLFASLYAVSRALRTPQVPRALKFLPLMVVALTTGARTRTESDLAEPPRHRYAFDLELLGFVAAIVVLAMLWERASARRARVGALGVALAALAYDVATPRAFYRDTHDLAAMLTAAGLIVAARPAFTALGRVRPVKVAAAALALLALALTLVVTVEPRHPGWRATALRFGHYEPRLARALRLLVDFDGDGFSPIAWGGDCDDFNPLRNPSQHETLPGIDANCNGVSLPEHPTDADRGLTPPFGSPDLPHGAVDRLVLITIDCLRTDALRPEVMPRLHALAAQGLALTRLYSGGSQTLMSLPLMQRGSDTGLPAATRLGRRGITSSAIIGYFTLADAAAGFNLVQVPNAYKQRWSASEVTERGMNELRAAPPPRYLWLHYFDAHWPYVPVPADVAEPALAYPKPGYLAELSFIDREIGRLLDALESTGGLARTAILVTSDHGEAFGEHGVEYHGVTAYEPIVHVPAILVAPGVAPGVHGALVSHRDVGPTVLGVFGVAASAPDAELFGRSWLRLRGEPGAALHRFVITRSARSTTVYHGFTGPMAAIVEGRFKLAKAFGDGFRVMFDLDIDPGENNNVETQHPAEALALERKLELYRDLDAYP